MSTKDPVKTATEFMDAINDHSLEAMSNLMSDDHTFIDSEWSRLTGKKKVLKSWKEYYDLFPDYSITCTEIISEENRVVMIGFANGSVNGEEWVVPATWLAVVLEDKISEWRIYADLRSVRELLSKR